MVSISSENRATNDGPAREVRERLRELSVQFSLLNRQVGAKLNFKDVDLGCLGLVNDLEPVSPSALARRAGLHPATMTGILDRLERGGWITRERDPGDRRAVLIRATHDRDAEVSRLYAGADGALAGLCAEYTDAQLTLLGDFLHRVTATVRDATRRLPHDDTEPGIR